jgi:hypothetical protein
LHATREPDERPAPDAVGGVSKSKTTLFGARSSAEYGFAYFADITLGWTMYRKLDQSTDSVLGYFISGTLTREEIDAVQHEIKPAVREAREDSNPSADR